VEEEMLDETTASLVRNSLRIGEYNLLLGAGISLDSVNQLGKPLDGVKALTKKLCDAVGLSDVKPLSIASSILNDTQRSEYLTKPFSVTQAGHSVQSLPAYIWRRIFSLNIDDAVEVAYEAHLNPLQRAIPVNYDEDYSPTPNKSEVALIHLHGTVRIPMTPYVFSTTDYARLLSAGSRWASVFSQIVRTEPLIIIGTSFDEVDLQYYLQQRSTKVTRAGIGPSLFVAPDMDVASRHLCDRHGLLPIAATAVDFFGYLGRLLPKVPSPVELVLPDKADLFDSAITKRHLLQFFTDFSLVRLRTGSASTDPSPFLNGVPPTWDDMYRGLDIPRGLLGTLIVDGIAATEYATVLMVAGDPGDGASTTLKRVALNLVKQGIPVLEVTARGRIDADVARDTLAHIKGRPVIIADDLADRTGELDDLLSDSRVSRRIRCIIGTARHYRVNYIDERLAHHPLVRRELLTYSVPEREAVVALYNRHGLIGAEDAIQRKMEFVTKLAGSPAAVVACRILNDLKPLRQICQSLWDDALEQDRKLYLSLAIAEEYGQAAVYRPIAQELAGNASIDEIVAAVAPLPIVDDPEDAEQVQCGNTAVAAGVLAYVVATQPQVVRDAYIALASALSPYVNRSTIKKQTPEARLIGRILDAEETVAKLFGEDADSVFEQLVKPLGWNSRFWEQRALYFIGRDIERAVKHAKHAVSIERHPHPLTTLGKVLAASALSKKVPDSSRFEEAADVLLRAIKLERNRNRVTIHPTLVLLRNARKYIEAGGALSPSVKATIREVVQHGIDRFSGQYDVGAAIAELNPLL
jgi:hypothetical protein